MSIGKCITMMRLSLVAGLFVLCGASPVWATGYWWTGATDSDWSKAGNWGGTAYPNSDSDEANFTSGTTTTILSEDISVAKLRLYGSNAWNLDLNGHTINIMCTAAWSNGLRLHSCGGNPTTRRDFECTKGFFAKNGTIYQKMSAVSAQDQNTRPYMNFSNVSLTNGFNEMWFTTRAIFRDGSVWTLRAEQRIGGSYYRTAENSKWSCICVTGETTRVEAADYDLHLLTIETGFFLLDGARANWKNIYIGDDFRGTNALVSVDNSTLTVGNEIQLGSDTVEADPTGVKGLYYNSTKQRWYSDINFTYGGELEVKGTNARVTAETLTIYEGIKVGMTFEVPEAGWANAPLEITNFTSVARNPDYPYVGKGTLTITCQQWAKTHGEETIPLVYAENGLTAAALDEITNTVVWADYTPQQIAEGKVPTLSVSADGKTLQVTAPAVNYKPTFEISSAKGTAVGNKTIKLHVIDYGYDATSLVSITCEYADNAEFAGSSTTNFLAGLSPVTTAAPCDLAYVLIGGFVQHQTYYVRITATNENGQEFEQTMTFAGDGVAENLHWKYGVTAGSWQDAANWVLSDDVTPANTYPHAEDAIKYIQNGPDLTITFSEDAEACGIENNRSTNNRLLFALNGHTLTFNWPYGNDVLRLDGSVTESEAFEVAGPRVIVSNGTLVATKSCISLGYFNGGSGSLYLEDHATMDATIRYLNSTARVYVRGGSELKPGYLTTSNPANFPGFDMHSHTAKGNYPMLCVTGENSRVSFSKALVRIRGCGAACYIQQGARIDAKDFDIGGTNFCWGGSASGIKDAKGYGRLTSPDTHVHVENATLNVGETLTMGWTGDSVGDTPCNPRLVMSGTGTVVTVGGTLKIYEGMAGAIEFELPKEGFAQTPLTAKALAFAPRTLTDFGATALKLRGLRAWSKAHSNESMTLIKLTEPNAAGLEQLRTTVTFDYSKISAANLTVSADGTELILTSPVNTGMMFMVR